MRGSLSCLWKRLEQIQLGVFLDLDPQVVQLLDGRIAGKEIGGTRAEGDDLQMVQPVDSPCNGQEIVDHIGAFAGSSHRIFRNVCLYATQFQIIAGVEHTAVGIPTAGGQHAGVFLGSGTEHLRTVKVLCQQRLGDLRTKVAQIDAQRIASGFFQIVQRLYHVDLAFHNADGTFVDILGVILFGIGIHQRLAAVYRQALRKAVTADCDNADFHFRNI